MQSTTKISYCDFRNNIFDLSFYFLENEMVDDDNVMT